MKKIGWGIIGPGGIAKDFVKDLKRCENASLVAVASRSIDRAQSVAKEFGFKRAYGSYEELVQDKEVDIVYIATPHPFHKDQALLCMNAGKAVLCEKPVTVSANEIKEIVECARSNNVFFMEAMWSRFFPVNRKVRELIQSGEIGKPTMIKADFCFGKWTDGKVSDKGSRLVNMDLAGGALLDVGIYVTSFTTYMKGQVPVEVKAMSTKVETGADGLTTMLFKYNDDTMAMLTCATVQNIKDDAYIYCENGSIYVESFWHPTSAVVSYMDDRDDKIISDDYTSDGSTGFGYEAEHAMECMNAGLLESPLMTWQNSIEIMEVLDEVREQINLVYPFE